MKLTVKQTKKKYFDKVLDNAEVVKCACGCGANMKNRDNYGRQKKFINGHNGRKYEDKTQHKREWNHRNKESRYESKVKRGHILKVKIIKLLGGKCDCCNLLYNGKNACVFQVHHQGTDKKEFQINTRTLINYAWSKILAEVKKCKLLCANCHFIHHNKEY